MGLRPRPLVRKALGIDDCGGASSHGFIRNLGDLMRGVQSENLILRSVT